MKGLKTAFSGVFACLNSTVEILEQNRNVQSLNKGIAMKSTVSPWYLTADLFQRFL